MKISTKIVLSNIITVLFPLCAAIFAVFSISSLNKQVEDVNKNHVQKILKSSRYMEIFQDHMRLLRELSIPQDKTTVSEIEIEMKKISAEVNELMDYMTKNIGSDAELKIINSLKTTREKFLNARERYINLLNAGDFTNAVQTYKQSLQPLENDYRTLLTQYSQVGKQEIEKVQSDSQRKFSSSLITLIVLGVISVVVCVIMSIYLSSTIRKPIKNATDISQKIANGSMEPIDVKTINKDEFLPLFESLNVMITTISTVIDEIRKATQQLTDGVLSYRVDQSNFKGDYQLLIKEFNAAVEEMARPLRVITNYIDQLAKGEIPDLITSDEKGEYKITKDAINNLINTNKEIIGLATKISKGDINVQLAKRSGDDKLVEALENMVQALKYLMQDINEIAKNSADGNLDFDINSNKYEGKFKDIIVSFLNTIESFKSPLKETLIILQNLAEGNLTQMMNGDYRGDFDKLKDTTNATINSLNDLIYQVQISAEEVSQGAMQVSAASQALSQGATEQAASLEEITSSTTQVASQTRVNADNAHQAQVITNETKQNADSGTKQMNELVEAMNEINLSSENISKIIRVIDEIAFQTNLLALNAAVEAARAERFGKGFAVVAEEVRNLAQRSAQAANETTELINNSKNSVSKGLSIVSKTNETLDEIRISSIKSADIVAEIAAASNEQALAISQINEGLNQIDKVTQTNTASAEESASAAQELSSQTKILKEMIQHFRLNKQAAASVNRTTQNTLDQGPLHRELVENSNYNYDVNPSDVIKLDEDDFGRY